MSKPDYTPGPWRHGRKPKSFIRSDNSERTLTFGADLILADDGETAICQVYGINLNTTLEEALASERCAEGIANARLIAAAPEMYEILASLVRESSAIAANYDVTAAARILLAKIDGGEQG